MAILSALIGANQKAFGYSMQGKQAYNEALGQYMQKRSGANAAKRQATSVLTSAGRNMMTARVNQTNAQGAARAAQAASGMQADTGSGGRLEKQVTAATDKAIADTARQASDQAGTLYGKATTLNNSAESALRLGEKTQAIYSKLASRTKTAGWLEAGIDGAIAITTGILGYSDATSGEAGEWAQENPFAYAMSTAYQNSDGMQGLQWLFQRNYSSSGSSSSNNSNSNI